MVAAGAVGVVGVVGVEPELLLLEPPHPESAMPRASRLPVSGQNDVSRQQVTRIMVPSNVWRLGCGGRLKICMGNPRDALRPCEERSSEDQAITS